MALLPIPKWTEVQMSQFFDTTMKEALARGLTSIHDAGVEPKPMAFYKKYISCPLGVGTLALIPFSCFCGCALEWPKKGNSR